jgi:uncharacterized protein with NRDE domain
VCLILLYFQVHPQLPLVVAANRDEYYARRASGVERLASSPRIVGARDLERGGTWMGAAEGGLFVGLTNQRTVGRPEPTRRSRGEIVMSALHAGSVAGVEALIAKVDARAYNPFNLVFGDARSLRVAYGREGEPTVRVQALPRGLHVLGNDALDAPSWKTRRATELAAPLTELPWFELSPALHRLLGDHALPAPEEVDEPPPWMDRELARHLQAICVHTPAYGTRSATLAAVGNDGVIHYVFAPGPPCTTPMHDVTRLLADG